MPGMLLVDDGRDVYDTAIDMPAIVSAMPRVVRTDPVPASSRSAAPRFTTGFAAAAAGLAAALAYGLVRLVAARGPGGLSWQLPIVVAVVAACYAYLLTLDRLSPPRR